ncbi:MAG: amino acid adenylation domain-containing protein, partial [bacterium]|nr:amino acid adenylation domain-containing protein [bacterium]
MDFNIRYDEMESETLHPGITPFDLSRPPLMTLRLVKFAAKKHYLVFDIHHIITDGSSSAIFIKEFMALYDGRQLAPLRIRYKDYAQWQNRDRQRKRIDKQEEYWLNTFAGPVPLLDLPTDFSRPPTLSFEGKWDFFEVPEAQTSSLNRMALERETTLYTLLLSIYYILLHRLTRQEDIILGAPTAGRGHDDLRNIIGMFLNTLALRNHPRPGITFSRFLDEVRTRTFEAFENQEYQFDELVEKLELKRDSTRNPLFDAMFILQNLDIPEIEIPGLKVSPARDQDDTAKFDLSLYAVESGPRIKLVFNYSTKLFEPATIQVFINYFNNILSAVLENPGLEIGAVDVIGEEEKHGLLEHFNRDLKQEAQTLLQGKNLFQEKMDHAFSRYKDRVAIEYKDQTLTYAQLDQNSNTIAHWLLQRGMKRETFIGVLIDDRMQLITAIPGILKACCVFVPLDPSYPLHRLETIIQLTGITTILCNEANLNRFAHLPAFQEPAVEFVSYDRLFENRRQNPRWLEDKPRASCSPEDKIYIYFTSGSTGTPKAIVGKNIGLLHYINWEIDALGFKEGYRVSQFITPVFDPFLRDVFVTLGSGSVICIPPTPQFILNPGQLTQWIEKHSINVVRFVPSVFRLIDACQLNEDRLKALKLVLLSGEKTNPPDLADWMTIFGHRVTFVNLYGPTETTVVKVFHIIGKTAPRRLRIPVGKPINSATLIILDQNMNPCPPLVKGEIHIRTPFLSHGYYNHPELNAKHFIPNPFNSSDHNHPADILYKTGDLGQILPDGNLDILGRIDRQVKIRGQRVEPEGIESVLTAHPAVKEAAVIARETPNQDHVLYAYITPDPAGQIETDSLIPALEEYVSQQMPAYLVPSGIVTLEQLPRNPNGKSDYQRL